MVKRQVGIYSLVLIASWVMGRPGGAEALNYIGAERCKSCHEFEYQVWSAGPHARSRASLTNEQIQDPRCDSCHTMVPSNLDSRFANVQCERCHGPGQYYHRPFVMKDSELARAVGLIEPRASHCEQCHTQGSPSISPFHFEKMWERIDHGKMARVEWLKAQGRGVSPAE